MAFYRSKRDDKFTVLSNKIVQNPELTYLARGLLEYMLSLPDDWKFYKSDLVKRSPKEGKDTIQRALDELIAAGYVRISQKREKSGQFGSLDWIVADTPVFPPQREKPLTVKPSSAKPSTVNPQLQNTNLNKELNKQRTNDKYSSSDKSEPHIPYNEIISYLNKKTGKAYHFTTKSYQRLIKARWNEGFRVDDFKQVIDNKCFDWQGNATMCKYLRPDTLFGSKFDSYLNENNAIKDKTPYDFASLENTAPPEVDDEDLPF